MIRFRVLFLFCFIFNIFVFANNIFADAATSSQVIYKIPKEGVRIKSTEANYSIFPDHLNFVATGRNIFVVSRYWQTGCLYDTNGNLMSTTSKNYIGRKNYICMQTATGKKELPTELGLYNIQTKEGQDYKSGFFSTTGKLLPGQDQKIYGAPMAWAMHFGRIIGNMENNNLLYDYTDGSALHEKQTINQYGSVSYVSHGCIAIEKGNGKFLQSIMTYGDLILVVDQTFPNTLNDAISLSK